MTAGGLGALAGTTPTELAVQSIGWRGMFTALAVLSLQSLWAGPWQSDVAGLSRADVANSLFGIALVMVVGFLSIGTLAERLTHFGVPLITFC